MGLKPYAHSGEDLPSPLWRRVGPGKLFVRYRGHERNELVSSDTYRLWLEKPWSNKNQGFDESDLRSALTEAPEPRKAGLPRDFKLL
ncbi:hypothetical protein DPMN_125120, partial [Dreissena polymorpha]